ncbi:MFS transporter [Gordonia sp. ABSL11-1]|uniref:MFS transporter n=1 Tax=Gordonia sp. ABSL11-1 TaxID=3053924 RepID=UPI002572B4BF|nr:MFS transporter [Gordonia sp. ABSL11-1]MDL9947214.1 MFS transporter [Gordonia sp. ABSL11-1]
MSTERTHSTIQADPAPWEIPAGLRYAIGTGVFLLSLNSSMIAVAIPEIRDHLGGSASGLAWLISGLYVAAAVGAPTAGRLVDLYGPRGVYLGGLALLLAGSLAGSFSPDITALTISRVVIGLGGAAQYPAAIAIVRAYTSTQSRSMTKALATLSMAGQTAVAFGPPLGGLLVSGFGWRALFVVNVPLAAAAWLWVRRTAPADSTDDADRTRPQWSTVIRAIDLPGLATFVGATVSLMVLLLSVGRTVEASTAIWLGVSTGAFVVAHIVWEWRSTSPFIDVRLLVRNTGLSVTYVRTTVTYTAFYLVLYGLPVWLQTGYGLSAIATGAVVFPVAAVGFVSTALGSRLIKRAGTLSSLTVGNAAMTIVGLLLWFVVDADSAVWFLVVIAALLGLPNGFNSIGNQQSMFDSADHDHIGTASGIYRTCQYIAAALASVILELFLRHNTAVTVIGAIGAAVFVCGAVLLLTALPADRFVTRRHRDKPSTA